MPRQLNTELSGRCDLPHGGATTESEWRQTTAPEVCKHGEGGCLLVLGVRAPRRLCLPVRPCPPWGALSARRPRQQMMLTEAPTSFSSNPRSVFVLFCF